MRIVTSLVLYIALMAGANAAMAADYSEAEALRDGDMKKLVFHEAPKALGTTAFETEDGGEMTLADYAGKVLVVNFWATWCGPCKTEMPQLSALQEELGGARFEVVTIASGGRNPRPAIADFFAEVEVDNLPSHRDNRSALAREMGIMARPVTILVSEDGQEIARMRGEADWSSDSAKAIVGSLIAPADG